MFRLMIMRAGDNLSGAVFGAAVLAALMFYGVVPAPVVAASEPAPIVSVLGNRDHNPTDHSPFYGATLAEYGSGDVFGELDAPEPIETAALAAFVESGGIGAVNDAGDRLYVRVGTVRDLGFGTVTMTIEGPAICLDGNGEPMSNGEPMPCSGGEYMTDAWLGY